MVFMIPINHSILKESMVIMLSLVMIFSFVISGSNSVQTSLGKLNSMVNSPTQLDCMEALKKPIGTISLEFIATCLIFYPDIFKSAGGELFGIDEIIAAIEGIIEFP